MAIYRDAEDLINIGAYVKGSNEKIDTAIDHIEGIIGFIEQETHENFSFDEVVGMLENLVDF
jgi:flagellum-specific ATP synthase